MTEARSRLSVDAPAATSSSEVGFRPDIQGLRAIAVLAVVAHHLTGWPNGGYVGVDVFFVISGFLITQVLLREHQRPGRIRLTRFYRRRARRILPAAVVCLVLVVVAAALLYRAGRFQSVAIDAFWSMLFVSNWRFAVEGTDYLGSAAPASPLEHYWSLAVEEQFYLIWPLLVVLVMSLSGGLRRPHQRRRLLGWLVGALLICSFGWALVETAHTPTWAYFSTSSRAWELGAGALLAVLARRLPAGSPIVQSLMSLLGLGLIATALLLINSSSAVPAPWAALPVVGTLLVLAAGMTGRFKGSRLLTNTGAQYVGRISYSLYLWHLPVIIFLAALLPAGPMSVLVTGIVIGVLSVASFHFVEDPARRGGFLGGSFSRSRNVAVRRTGAKTLLGVVVGVGFIAAVVGLLVPVSTKSQAMQNISVSGAGGEDGRLDSTTAAYQLSTEIEDAVRAETWPVLTPEIDGIAQSGRPPKDADCAVGLADPDDPSTISAGQPATTGGADRPSIAGAAAACSFGDPTAPHLAVVVGDSIGITWIPLVQELLEPRGYLVQGLTMSGCPFVGTQTRNPAANIEAFCPDHKAAVVDAIQRLEPDVVFVANTFRPWLRGSPDTQRAATVYAEGQRAIIAQFGKATNAIYVLSPPPTGKPLEECATTVSSPTDCLSRIPDDWLSFDAAMAETLSDVASVTYVDTSAWFCTADGECPGFVGQTPVRRDEEHVVPEYARRLAPVLEPILK